MIQTMIQTKPNTTALNINVFSMSRALHLRYVSLPTIRLYTSAIISHRRLANGDETKHYTANATIDISTVSRGITENPVDV